jgi:hypothetical protein
LLIAYPSLYTYRKLIELDADVNRKNDKGETIYDNAVSAIKEKDYSRSIRKEMISALKNSKKGNK